MFSLVRPGPRVLPLSQRWCQWHLSHMSWDCGKGYVFRGKVKQEGWMLGRRNQQMPISITFPPQFFPFPMFHPSPKVTAWAETCKPPQTPPSAQRQTSRRMPNPSDSLNSHAQNMSSGPCWCGCIYAQPLPLHPCPANSTKLKSQLKLTTSMKLPVQEESEESPPYRRIALVSLSFWTAFTNVSTYL